MSLRSRTSAIRSNLPKSRLLILLVLSIAVTWLLVYLQTVDYFVDHGIAPNKVGRGKIAFEVLDGTTVFFGFLVFLAAGIVPLTILFARATPIRSNIAQIVWAVLIIVLLLFTRAIS